MDVRFVSLGDSALTVEFGNVISVTLNENAIALSDRLTRQPFPGFIEAVPAYASTTVFYDIFRVRSSFPQFEDAFSAVKSIVESNLPNLEMAAEKPRSIEIPVRFDRMAGPDLAEVGEISGHTAADIVDLFTAGTYRVYMLGFLPGFAYMGEVDDRIAVPRKATPRPRVEKGSVGIAGKQTGIYSLTSPGGWQIVGRTEVQAFTPHAESPCLLRPGDRVKFVAV